MPFDINSIPDYNTQQDSSTEASQGFDINTVPDYSQANQQSSQVPIENSPDFGNMSKYYANKDPLGGVKAFVGGMSNAGGKAVETAIDAGAYVLGLTGAISKEKKRQVYDFAKNATAIYKTNYGDGTDIFSKAQKENPTSAALGNAAVAIPALAATGISGGGAKAFIGNTALGGLVNAGMNPETDNSAALSGALFSAGAQAIGSTIKGIAKYATQSNPVPEAVNTIKQNMAKTGSTSVLDDATDSLLAKWRPLKDQSDELWKGYKSLPGSINTSQVTSNLTSFVEKNKPYLGTAGIDIENLVEKSKNLATMDDVISFRNEFRAIQHDLPKSYALRQTFQALGNTVDDLIDKKGQEAGLTGFSTIKAFYRNNIDPILQATKGRIYQLEGARNQVLKRGNEAYSLYQPLRDQVFSGFAKNPEKTRTLLASMSPEGKDAVQKAFLLNKFTALTENPDAQSLGTVLKQIQKWKADFNGIIGNDNLKILNGAIKVLKDVPEIKYADAPGLIKYPIDTYVKSARFLGSLMDTPNGQAVLEAIAKGHPLADDFKTVIIRQISNKFEKLGSTNDEK